MADSESPTNKLGRPLKFETVEQLKLAIQNYFDSCDPHIQKVMVSTGISPTGHTMFETREILTDQKPYTSHGLARALGIDRRTLLNYKKRDEFFPSVQAAMDRLAEYAESNLFGPYASGAKFSLTNNFSQADAEWSDKKAVDHTTKGQPMPLLGGSVELPSADSDEDNDVEAAD